MDEVSELHSAAYGLPEIARTADGFPPLYGFLLHGSLDLFQTDVAARWLSVFFGVSTIYFGWLLGRRIGGDRLGLWTALILAVSPVHIWYSQEGRAYALYVLLATIALWTLFRALQHDRLRDWCWYTITAATGVYVHYYFVVVVLVGGLLAIRHRRGFQNLTRPIAATAAIAALCLPLLSLLGSDLGLQAGPAYASQTRFGVDALGFTYLSLVTGYTLGPSLRELHTMKTGEAVAGFLPWLALMTPALVVLGWQGRRVLGNRTFEQVLLLILFPVVTIGLLGNLAGVGYNVRYVVWVAVPVAILLGAGATRWREWPVAASLAVLLGLFGIALLNRRSSDRYRNEDMRALSNYLVSLPENGVPVFVLSGGMIAPARYYLGQERPVFPVPDRPVDSSRVAAALQSIAMETEAGKPYWLVYTREFQGDPQGAIREALERRDSLRVTRRFAGIVLYRGVRPKDSQASPETSARPTRSVS